MKSKRKKLLGGALIVAVAAGLAPVLLTGQDKNADVLRNRMKIDATPVDREGGIAKSYANIVDKVKPSVVSIYTSKTLNSRNNQYLRFYGNRLRREDLPKQTGLGSGVIISPDGYILTNNHVVGDVDEIKVALSDDTEHIARLVGRDEASEVAVIKIEATGLPAVTVADSEKVKVGDVVLAFGNPFGLEQTVSMGIVSGTGRKNIGIARYGNFIQTDASINPGNSGGALVDADGRLIGVNTAIFSQTGGSVGIGFAIPTKMAMNVVDELVEKGSVTRGFLGIQMADMNDDFAKYLKRDSLDGVVVAEVVRNTPAHRAGLRPYDLILERDGKPVSDVAKLSLAISELDPGTEVKFKVMRDGRESELRAVLSAQDSPFSVYGSPSSDTPAKGRGAVKLARGVSVANLTKDVRLRLQIGNNIEGLVVTEVDRDAPRKNARLSPGDIVIEVNRKPVRAIEDLAHRKDDLDRVLVRVIGASDGETRLYVLDA